MQLNWQFVCSLGKEVKIIRYKNDGKLTAGNIIEVRGIVNKDGTISFGEYTMYDMDFDLQAYETMLVYYHGMCKELCVKWELLWSESSSNEEWL